MTAHRPADDNGHRNSAPIFTALKRSGDTETLDSVKKWMRHDLEPNVAANDNNAPDGYQVECYMDTMSAETLIAAYEAGEYHIGLHEEKFRRPRGARMVQTVDSQDDAEDEMSRYADRNSVRDALGDHAAVLDMACDGFTYREVGEHLGYAGKYAERKGKGAVKAAARLFSDIAA